jgi:MscS family membrane protein
VEGVVEGTVENIGFRSTLVRRFDKAPVFVPNSHLSDNSVTNFSSMTYRRISWTIGLEYRTSVDQLKKIREDIELFLVEDKDIVDPPAAPLFVRIDKFSNSSIDIMIYCFTHATQWGVWLQIKERLALKLIEIVTGAGASFAFPSQSVYVETMPSEHPFYAEEKKG